VGSNVSGALGLALRGHGPHDAERSWVQAPWVATALLCRCPIMIIIIIIIKQIR
jgi:hypothetical protein